MEMCSGWSQGCADGDVLRMESRSGGAEQGDEGVFPAQQTQGAQEVEACGC